MGIHLCN